MHILADFGCLPGAGCTAHLVIFHLFRQVADFERFGVVGDLVEAHRVRQLRLDPIIEHINDFLRFLTPGVVELFLMLQVAIEGRQRRISGRVIVLGEPCLHADHFEFVSN